MSGMKGRTKMLLREEISIECQRKIRSGALSDYSKLVRFRYVSGALQLQYTFCKVKCISLMSRPIENSPYSSPVQEYPKSFQALLKDDEQPPLFKQMNLKTHSSPKKLQLNLFFHFKIFVQVHLRFCTTC